MWLLLLWSIWACVAPTPQVQVLPADAGLEVESSVALGEVVVHDELGRVVVRHRPASPQSRMFVPARLTPGQRVRVVADGQEIWLEVPTSGPVEVRLQAPLGGADLLVGDGDQVRVATPGEEVLRSGLVVTARQPGEAVVRGLGAEIPLRFSAAGQRQLIPFALKRDPLQIRVQMQGQTTSARVIPVVRTPDASGGSVMVRSSVFPADPLGMAVQARPADRVQLVPQWWRSLLSTWGLGYRALDEQMPWAWQGVTLRNRDDLPWTVLIEAEIVDGAGVRVPGFQPVIRGQSQEAVQVLMRLPAGGEGVATLPVFVRPSLLSDHGSYIRRVSVTPLGATEPVATLERPIVVQRGSLWATAGMVIAALVSVIGWLGLFGGLRWTIRRLSTSQLVTIGLFGSLTWVAGAVLQVVGLGVSTLLGPFAPLLTGIPDDALRACLLGTLLTLVPRRGVAALATCVGFLMRGLTTGAFHPVDLLYLGSTVFWLESWLWLSGVTGGPQWRDQGSTRVWARLAVALGGSNVCGMATGLVVSVAFYRLYYADWYVGLMLALPGFAYVVLGCGLAVPFARSLRRVEG